MVSFLTQFGEEVILTLSGFEGKEALFSVHHNVLNSRKLCRVGQSNRYLGNMVTADSMTARR